MSKYNYPNWHEIKDLVSIYREDEWDNAKIVVWEPSRQKEYSLVFCGSSRPSEDEIGTINFTLVPTNPTWYDNFRMKFTFSKVKVKYSIRRFFHRHIKLPNKEVKA